MSNCQTVKSFDWQIDSSLDGFDKANVLNTLKDQFRILEGYEFERQFLKNINRISQKYDSGYVHERYKQYYKGIKIEESDVRVHYLNGSFISANGEYINASNIDVSVVLSKENAIQKAKKYTGAKKYIWEDEKECEWIRSNTKHGLKSCYPDPEIVICRNRFMPEDTLFHTAYKVNIHALEPLSHYYLYVDAKNGKILNAISLIYPLNGIAETRYSGTRTISTSSKGMVYALTGYDNNGRNIETYNMNRGISYANATDFTDNNNIWTAAEYDNAYKDNGALDAHWGAMMTYDYFKNIHGRYSYDNYSSTIRNYVHANLTGMGYQDNDNASWNSEYEYITYGDGTFNDMPTSLDIIAHEIGHGVCQYSADLVYQGEPGAINESLSDIWGACVKNYATPDKFLWHIGEDIGTIRSMAYPKALGQPNTYGGTYWQNPNSIADHGGVHTNSGVMNHWFYILCMGKSGTIDDIPNGVPYDVTGIGIEKAEQIVYRFETDEATTTYANFAAARTRTIKAAIDLYGHCSPEVISVTNAWYAVGVGEQYVAPPNNVASITYGKYEVNGLVKTIKSCCDLEVGTMFSVANGASVTLTSSSRIRLLPGFRAKAGSRFHAKIDPDLCSETYNSAPALVRKRQDIYIDTAPVEEIKTAESMAAIEVYPNPASDKITVKTNTGEYIKRIEIKNSIGTGVLSLNPAKSFSTDIDISDLASGIYFVRVFIDDVTHSVKVIKK